jgi:hypothetical protein
MQKHMTNDTGNTVTDRRTFKFFFSLKVKKETHPKDFRGYVVGRAHSHVALYRPILRQPARVAILKEEFDEKLTRCTILTFNTTT